MLANVLRDSGCEGVMVSPDFACAMGMALAKLEQPIGLQLACVGSKSTINYGTETTIVFGDTHVKEYFDVSNIDYYDIILGTPFLQCLGSCPGLLWPRDDMHGDIDSLQEPPVKFT